VKPLVIAHRGASSVELENTLAAFRAAAGQGADGVELDVHRTEDGELVVRHDADTPAGLLRALTLADVREQLPEVPTLADVLDVCRGRLVNVEIKDPDPRAAEAVVDLLAERDRADEVIVSSFDLATVDRVRAVGSEVPTGLLTVGRRNLPTLLDLAAERGHAAIHPDRRALSRRYADAFVDDARERGLRVNVWTVNAPATITRLAEAGVDALITDVPDVARRALGLS